MSTDDGWPHVTEQQRAVLEALHASYMEFGEWPNHAYLEQQLEEQDIELNDELTTLPERMIAPDNRMMGGRSFIRRRIRSH